MIDRASARNKNWLAFLAADSAGACMRVGLVQSPSIRKKTGFPWKAAASMRNGLSEPGHFPVHAARISEADSEFHVGSAGFSCAGSRSAALNKTFQSKLGGA